MESVFVTGSDGLLGSNLVRELIARDYQVTAMIQKGRNPVTLNNLPVKQVVGDITSPQEVKNLSKGFDYFMHVAALTDMWPSRGGNHFLINVEGTKNVINAALENGVKRLIHVGSASSFGYGCLTNPGDEESPYKSFKYNLDYMNSKQSAHELVKNAVKKDNLPALTVCPTFMIGPYDARPSSGALVLALAKKKLPFLPSGGKNWASAKDVAVASCNALTKGRIGESYILGGENLSYKDAVRRMAHAIDLKYYPLVVMPDFIMKTIGFLGSTVSPLTQKPPKLSYSMACVACDHHYFSSTKAILELDLPQTPIEQATQELHSWFIENHYL
jgi:dihydroflavonol-4-reductase